MNRHKLIGAVALGLLILLGFASRHVPVFSQNDWGTWWELTYLTAICIAFFCAFYDRKSLPEKTWDLNPKRGLLYFFLGWIIFPVMLGVEAFTSADFSVDRMLLGTLTLSILAGVFGTFTENVGI